MFGKDKSLGITRSYFVGDMLPDTVHVVPFGQRQLRDQSYMRHWQKHYIMEARCMKSGMGWKSCIQKTEPMLEHLLPPADKSMGTFT